MVVRSHCASTCYTVVTKVYLQQYQLWRMRKSIVASLLQLQGQVSKSKRKLTKLSVLVRRSPTRQKQHWKHPTITKKVQRDDEHGYEPALEWQYYGNTPQWGQVSWEENPCVVWSPNSMPSKAKRRICCRPERSAEAPQENCVAVLEG